MTKKNTLLLISLMTGMLILSVPSAKHIFIQGAVAAEAEQPQVDETVADETTETEEEKKKKAEGEEEPDC
ncbi:MAG: hypothetical protein V3V09_08695 [Arenicellales bacterium]